MNVAELGTELGKLVERAMAEGIIKRKMTVEELIGALELQKLELARHFQDVARMQAVKNQQIIHLPGGRLPPPPGTS